MEIPTIGSTWKDDDHSVAIIVWADKQTVVVDEGTDRVTGNTMWFLDNYTPDKEPWKPEMEESYHYPAPYSECKYIYSTWMNDPFDLRLLSRNMVFRTEEEAIAMADKMLEVAKIV